VLFLATGIGKAQVDEFHFVVLNSLDHIGHGHAESPQTEIDKNDDTTAVVSR
jgi:hypothetical protein